MKKEKDLMEKNTSVESSKSLADMAYDMACSFINENMQEKEDIVAKTIGECLPEAGVCAVVINTKVFTEAQPVYIFEDRKLSPLNTAIKATYDEEDKHFHIALAGLVEISLTEEKFYKALCNASKTSTLTWEEAGKGRNGFPLYNVALSDCTSMIITTAEDYENGSVPFMVFAGEEDQ